VLPDLVDAGCHRRLERRRGVTGAAATRRAPVRVAASLQHQSDVRERRRLPVQYPLLPIGPEMMAFALKPLSFPHLLAFGSRYLIRKYRTDSVRVQGCPVPNWGPGTVRTANRQHCVSVNLVDTALNSSVLRLAASVNLSALSISSCKVIFFVVCISVPVGHNTSI
jgi:hypothetical protein